MLDQRVVFEHIRAQVETQTGRSCYLAHVPSEVLETPYVILWPIGASLRPEAPLEAAPSFQSQLQTTCVGRTNRDAEWMHSVTDDALRSMPAPTGASAVHVEQTVAPFDGPSEGVVTTVARYSLQVGEA